MPHAHTARLIDAWRLRRPAGERLPARTALSPLLFGALSPQMFVLAEEEADGEDGRWRFRTAGALLDDLHGRPLAGAAFAGLWAPLDRPAVDAALEFARRTGAPRVLTCRGETARGGSAVLEVALAPATGPGGRADRALGLLQPLTPLARLGGAPLLALHLHAPSRDPRPRLVVDNTAPRPLGYPGADVAER